MAAAVLSGNRNFEGRVNPLVKANYLASPPLVVAYALAGTVDIDLLHRAAGPRSRRRGRLPQGDLAHSRRNRSRHRPVRPARDVCQPLRVRFRRERNVEPHRSRRRRPLPLGSGSTYVQEPPFLLGLSPEVPPIRPIRGARVLALLGDSVTTDHISPAGAIAQDSPAGRYLIEHGVAPARLQQLRLATRQ